MFLGFKYKATLYVVLIYCSDRILKNGFQFNP